MHVLEEGEGILEAALSRKPARPSEVHTPTDRPLSGGGGLIQEKGDDV